MAEMAEIAEMAEMETENNSVTYTVTCVRLRRHTDIFKIDAGFDTSKLFVTPYYGLPDKEKISIFEHFIRMFSDDLLLYNAGFGDAQNFEINGGKENRGRNLCVFLYSVDDLDKVPMRGTGIRSVYVNTLFPVDKGLRMMLSASTNDEVGIFWGESRQSKDWVKIGDKWITRIIQVGCGYLLIKSLHSISTHLKDVHGFSFITLSAPIRLKVENFNNLIKRIWGK